MIMVVALLVLLAVMGTAYLATSRTDRVNSIQSQANQQVEHNINGVISSLQQMLMDDLHGRVQTSVFDTSAQPDRYQVPRYFPDVATMNRNWESTDLRAQGPYPIFGDQLAADQYKLGISNFEHFDGPGRMVLPIINGAGTQVDAFEYDPDPWLADRVPTFVPNFRLPLSSTAVADPLDLSLNRYAWRWISAPFSGIQVSDTEWEFDDPYGTAFAAPRHDILPHIDPGAVDPTVPQLAWTLPGTTTLAWRPAADTDGDGIADAFLSRLQGATTNGLTTYVAWRIIDNAAAVNAAVAWEHKRNPSGTPFVSGDNLFPVNIGLADPIGPNDNLNNPATSLVLRQDLPAIQGFRTRVNDPYNPRHIQNPIIEDGSTVRPDFDFRDPYDWMWHQLGRRLELPGFNVDGFRLQRVPAADTLALAAGFVVGTTGLRSSTLESLSLRTEPLRWAPYTPGNVRDITELWGDNNFADRLTTAHANAAAFEPGASGSAVYNTRPLLVTSNPVSQAAPVHLSRPWLDRWEFEHWTPFHPEYRNAAPGNNNASIPDMLDYDLASRYRGFRVPGREYTPGDIVRVGNRTYLCVAMKGMPGISGANANIDPTALHQTSGSAAADAAVFWEYQPYTPIPMKASLNTAPFRELYRAFWSVMCNEQDPDLHPLTRAPFSQTPGELDNKNFTAFRYHDKQHVQNTEDVYGWQNAYPTDNENRNRNTAQMFRSSIRDNSSSGSRIRLNGKNQALLRSALAAINTIDLRDSEPDTVTPKISSRTITLEMEEKGSPTAPQHRQVVVDVYGNERQPFITRVYLSGGKHAQNLEGFVLIELFNPYRQTISLNDWKILLVDRPSTPGTRPKLSSVRSLDIPDRDIPPGQYLFLTNLNAGGTSPAQVDGPDLLRPTQQPPGHDPWVRIANLHEVQRREFIIVRPRLNGSITGSGGSGKRIHYNDYDENRLTDMVPIDQHDLTGVNMYDPKVIADPNDDVITSYYYWRLHNTTTKRFGCVYGGRYYPDKSNSAASPRHEGVVYLEELAINVPDGPSVKSDPRVANGVDIGTSKDSSSDRNADRFPPIQLNNDDFAGPNKSTGNTNNMYPFGGFARVGDVLQVPFIGAYRIRELTSSDPNEFVEMNSISMDSAFVADRDPNNDFRENLGRFCPIPENPFVTTSTKFSYYDWAKDIFDHFTVFAPYDDYFPNVVGGPPTEGFSPNYPPFATANAPYHVATKFQSGTPVQDQPSEQAVEGLININTAPWRVLATVPWTTGVNASTSAQAYNYNIAKAIVRHREVNGPFKSIADLQNVRVEQVPNVGPSVQSDGRFWQQIGTATDPDDDEGDLSPANPPPAGTPPRDGVTGNVKIAASASNTLDFEHQFLALTRVSNLITTRSDSFTAYICLQQWENAGTPDARMVSQRRYAVLLDRSGILKDKKDVKVSYVPID
jgi:hypothetical protein